MCVCKTRKREPDRCKNYNNKTIHPGGQTRHVPWRQGYLWVDPAILGDVPSPRVQPLEVLHQLQVWGESAACEHQAAAHAHLVKIWGIEGEHKKLLLSSLMAMNTSIVLKVFTNRKFKLIKKIMKPNIFRRRSSSQPNTSLCWEELILAKVYIWSCFALSWKSVLINSSTALVHSL